jgi:putative tricarboxylic transport membrane protein
MLDALGNGLLLLLQVKPLLYMLIGSGIGFWVGILPGIGGVTTLALMLPFIYKMTPMEAFPFLLGMHSVVQTTGDITSVLFGIPGEPTTVATIIDGYQMSKKGEAGRALGAALMSSLVGAIIGAIFLALAIPVVRPLVLAFGSPEMFMMIVVGLTCISSLSGEGARGLLHGATAGAFGFLLSMVGQDPQVGVFRFTFGQLYLWNGVPMVPVVVGLFAIPEIVELTVQGTGISGAVHHGKLEAGVIEGIKDTFRYFWLTVRCSLIGCAVGVLPGLGGGVSQWLAYAHAVQSAKTLEERAGFGRGDVRGVLGPGSANNSKEGASLITTVGFGVPTTSSMAVLLGAFYLLGMIPGPDMLSKHLAITYSMVWTIALSNIVVVAVSLLFINHLAKLTTIRGNLITPFILLLTFIGSYTTNNSLADIVTTIVFGGVGYLMVRFGFPRPPFILAFILGNLAEDYLYTSIARYEAAWLLRPWVIVFMLVAIAVAYYPFFQVKRLEKKEAKRETTG